RAGEASLHMLRDILPAAAKAHEAVPGQSSQIETIEQKRRIAAAGRWAQDLLNAPIRSFAARTPTEVNRQLAAGERSLRGGRYYEALEYFNAGRQLDPANPLIDLARGHALAAAGDYIAAVSAIEKA